MAARSFLWVIVGLVMLTLAAALTYRLFGEQILRAAMVPSIAFNDSPQDSTPDYNQPEAWLARPDHADNPAQRVPKGYIVAETPAVATFFVTPSAYLKRSRWNSPLSEADMNERLNGYLEGQASVFNGVSAIWSPRYRQATFGAFLSDRTDAQAALDFAYRDVVAAFDAFMSAQPANQPIILAGHSQGSLHLMRLIKDRIANTPIEGRIVAAYLGGWPVSLEADIPALSLPACSAADQAGCVLSWQSFAEPADTTSVTDSFNKSASLTGLPRRGTHMLCINPLTGAPDTSATASNNPGALLSSGKAGGTMLLQKGTIGARCENGFLLIGNPPEGFGQFMLPGNNFHVYDYALFWAALRQDAEKRTAIWQATAGQHK